MVLVEVSLNTVKADIMPYLLMAILYGTPEDSKLARRYLKLERIREISIRKYQKMKHLKIIAYITMRIR